LSSAFVAKKKEMAEKDVEEVIERLEEYHRERNWNKLFNENVIDINLITSYNKKEILGFSLLIAVDGGPIVEFLCHRGTGEIIYSRADFEVRREVPHEFCREVIDYLRERFLTRPTTTK